MNASRLNSSMPRHRVSIILPAYKEEEHVEDTITDVIGSLRRSQYRFEVIVVLDSVLDDRTGSILHKLCQRFREIQLVERLGRHGVGNAIMTGIKLAKGDILIPVMGDHSESSHDLMKLIDAISRGYDVAIGERFKSGRPQGYPFLKYILNRCCNYIVRYLFHIPSFDTTNAFKAYRAHIVKRLSLHSKGFEIFLELPLKTFLDTPTARIINIPIQHSVKIKREAKLSLLREGPRYIKIILSLLFCRWI